MNVYDFDHTIYRGDSSLDFFFFVLRRRPCLALLAPLQAWGILQYLFRQISKETMKAYFFRFVRFIPVDVVVAQFWERHIRKIAIWYWEQRNDRDVIISASPEFLLEPVVKEYMHGTLIASKIDPKTGAYNGKNCYGEEKVRRFREIYADEKIDQFYSDSLSDAPLALIAEKSFMVTGDHIVPWSTFKESFIEKIKRTYFSRDFIIFVFCGGMGTLTNFICSLLISTALNPSLSYICGYCLSLFVAYTLNAKLIFHDPLAFIAFVKFVMSYIPNFLILFSFVLVFLNIAGGNKIIVYGLAGLLGLPVTFILVKIFAFGKQK
ncbi:MAG: haloacid dehalogenase-like hydrolase [Treponema sp.]|jgi:phosphoserine phosphatase/putative flippase GtrA|nr:haloacid dehalogenase-like hydrolase [Treponema sp.]